MKKALVIDDSSTVRSILLRMLADIGIAAGQAVNGQDALNVLEENQDTCLALVDWNMPIMSGIEFVKQVRAQQRFNSMKIIMVTTETEMHQIQLALESGVDEYIMKPFTKEILEDKLSMVGMHSATEDVG